MTKIRQNFSIKTEISKPKVGNFTGNNIYTPPQPTTILNMPPQNPKIEFSCVGPIVYCSEYWPHQ